jgi:hypothetical protein
MYIYDTVSLSSPYNEKYFRKKIVEKIKTFFCSLILFVKIEPFIWWCEKYGRARRTTNDNIIQCMCIACWVTKATDKCTEYVMLTDFPQHRWLCESTSVLYSYINFLSCFGISFPLISSYSASLCVLWFSLISFFNSLCQLNYVGILCKYKLCSTVLL